MPICLDAPKNLCSAAFSVSNFESASSIRDAEGLIHCRLRQMVADKIAEQHITKTSNVNHTVYRLDVYVLSASELFDLINRHANELSLRMGREDMFSR